MTKPRLSDRRFGLMTAAVLLALAGSGWVFFDAVPRWLLVAGVLFGLVALAAPRVLLPLNRFWRVLAERLGQAVNYVLLSLFFYLFVLPQAPSRDGPGAGRARHRRHRKFMRAGFEPTHFAHDGRWSPLGHEVAGRTTAEWLRRQGIGG